MLVAVGGTALVVAYHYFSEKWKSRKEAASGEKLETDAAEARELALEPEVFDNRPEGSQ